MPKVIYKDASIHISDEHIKNEVLQRIADHFGKDVKVTDGDNKLGGVKERTSKDSLHYSKMAADIHVHGMADKDVYEALKGAASKIFDLDKKYQVVYHGHPKGSNILEHVHIGHYNRAKDADKEKGTVRFLVELPKQDKNIPTQYKLEQTIKLHDLSRSVPSQPALSRPTAPSVSSARERINSMLAKPFQTKEPSKEQSQSKTTRRH